MFWSKIWFFLGAVAAAGALTVALILPRPASRQHLKDERQRLTTACSVFKILMVNNAKDRVALAGTSARAPRIVNELAGINPNRAIEPEHNRSMRAELNRLIDEISGAKPSFVVALDPAGRVVARKGIDERTYGDAMAGYYLVDDALDGYLRDDLWMLDDKLFFVAASPVVKRGPPDRWAGAILMGREVDREWVDQFVKQLLVNVSFYADDRVVASSSSEPIHEEVRAAYAKMSELPEDIADDCIRNDPFAVSAGDKTYLTLIARLPGEARERDAFYAVYTEQPSAIGLMGTLDAADQNDLAFGNFPWIPLGLGFVLFVAVGIALMVVETDRPLRRLANDAVTLAKGDSRRLEEANHHGKFGSIARSVNIHLDKLAREAKTAKPSVNDVLGPQPSALPAAGVGGPAPASFTPPPPSHFQFSDSRTPPPRPPPGIDLPPPRAVTPAPLPPRKPTDPGAKTPPPVPVHGSSPGFATDSIDDDILGGAAPMLEPDEYEEPSDVSGIGFAAGEPGESDGGSVADEADLEEEYRRVFDEFVSVKQQCGESTASLTYEKFAAKLRKNRAALIAKHNCARVKFQVYVKDGKAALKATPVGKA